MPVGAYAVASDTGRKRRRNEDNYVVAPPLFAVADGMGGAQAGEVASQLAASALEAGDSDAQEATKRIDELIQEANRRIFDRASTDPSASGMGTTMTVALVEGMTVAIGHVGDSRAYLVRGEQMEQLTDDHSLVNELVKSGKLSEEEAQAHPQRSVITRAVGTDPDVDVDGFTIEAEEGDVFLICSDGLTSMIDDETILGIVEPRRDDLNAAAKELIGAANRSGGEDNITVVFFEMTDKAPEPPAETKAMPVMQPPDPPSTEADEDTLSGLEGVPAVQTMVVAPGEAMASTDGAEPEQPKERFSVQAARLIVALAVVAALALLVYWLLGQSR